MSEPAHPSTAIYYVPAGFSTSGTALMGINVASEGSLKALACHSGADTLYAFTETAENADTFRRAVQGFNPAMNTEWIPTVEVGRLQAVGTVMLPGPGLGSFGWMRRRAGRQAYSLCGITHTTATPLVLDALADLLTAPVYPWDALICTSRAVQAMVTTILDDQQAYLADRFGDRPIPRPALPIIPLGVECAAFAPDLNLRAMRRAQLDLTDDDIVFLWMGRLSPHTKGHPMPLFQAIEMAASRTMQRLHLVMAGWFSNEATEASYQLAADFLCPHVTVHFVDAREPVLRREIWQVADIFVSPVDNIQESFGLTPIEAMSAGLPVIVSDWNGYRDTVRDGIDGFCIPTIAVPPGVCTDMAMRFAARMDNYDTYIGQASQSVMIDIGQLADAMVLFAADPERRLTMGEAGRLRATTIYDWGRIVPQYQQLWTELAQVRAAGGRPSHELPTYPARPDPFHAFESYPSGFAMPECRVVATIPSPGDIRAFLGSPLVAFSQSVLPSADELTELLSRCLGAGQTIQVLIETVPESRRRVTWRGIVWLGKFGFVRIERSRAISS